MQCIGTKIEGKGYKERKASYGLIFNEKKEIAVVYLEKDKMYNLIGGKIEENETSKEALIRECLEETGYNIKNIEYLMNLKCYYNINEKYTLGIMDFYIADLGEKNRKPIEEDHKLLWFKIEDIVDDMYFEYHRYILRKYLEIK